jgi:uncharacterized membrane protein YkgB
VDPTFKKTTYLPFLRNIIIFSGLIGVVGVILLLLLPANFFSPALPFLILFFMGMTIFVYTMLVKTFETRFARFVSFFMIATAGKLLICITVVIIYVLLNKQDALPFLASFFILYILYTIFEVTALLKTADRISRK